jgi:hypothetical protein
MCQNSGTKSTNSYRRRWPAINNFFLFNQKIGQGHLHALILWRKPVICPDHTKWLTNKSINIKNLHWKDLNSPSGHSYAVLKSNQFQSIRLNSVGGQDNRNKVTAAGAK